MPTKKKQNTKDYQMPLYDENGDRVYFDDEGNPLYSAKQAKGDPAYGKVPKGPVSPEPHVAAKHLEKFGLGSDTILAHINPEEADLLKKRGGSGAVNPHTGLLEFDGGGDGGGDGGSGDGGSGDGGSGDGGDDGGSDGGPGGESGPGEGEGDGGGPGGESGPGEGEGDAGDGGDDGGPGGESGPGEGEDGGGPGDESGPGEGEGDAGAPGDAGGDGGGDGGDGGGNPPKKKNPVPGPVPGPVPPGNTGLKIPNLLNPGYMQATPYYNTTNDVQSKYYWGTAPTQTGSTYDAQLANTIPQAPATAWGQQTPFQPLTGQELAGMVMGNPYQQNFQGQPALQPGFNPYRPDTAPGAMPGPTPMPMPGPPGGKSPRFFDVNASPGKSSTNPLDDYWNSILAGGR